MVEEFQNNIYKAPVLKNILDFEKPVDFCH